MTNFFKLAAVLFLIGFLGVATIIPNRKIGIRMLKVFFTLDQIKRLEKHLRATTEVVDVRRKLQAV